MLLEALLLAIIVVIAAFSAAWISHSAKISEFRQTSIEALRSDIAEYVGLAERAVGKSENEAANEAKVVLGRIRLRLSAEPNPNSLLDTQLLKSLDDLLDSTKAASWESLADTAYTNASLTLQRELEATKKFSLPRRSDFSL